MFSYTWIIIYLFFAYVLILLSKINPSSMSCMRIKTKNSNTKCNMHDCEIVYFAKVHNSVFYIKIQFMYYKLSRYFSF